MTTDDSTPATRTGEAAPAAEADDAVPAARAGDAVPGVGAGDAASADTAGDETAARQQEAGRVTPGRRLAYAVLATAAGAGLVLWGITRTWSTKVTDRPGLTQLRETHPGTDTAPLVLALALVALAGAGALFATKGVVRRVLGVLIAVAGVGVVVATIAGRAGLDIGEAGAGATAWPVVCVAGGLLVVLGGWWTVRHGHEWPGMGARYERTVTAPVATDDTGTVDARSAWDALDRGDDPTAR